MRLSRFPLVTLKEVPASAEIVSHRLMLRAGMIKRLASGLYSWLPLGLRVQRKVERIVREAGIGGRDELRVRWIVRGGGTATLRFSSEKARDVEATVEIP